MTGNSIEVVCATAEHLPEIAQLWRAIEKEYKTDDETEPERAVQGLRLSVKHFDFFASDSFWFLLARMEGGPVGYLTVVRIPKVDERLGVLYLDELHVLNNHRRRGVGSALIRTACRIGEASGYWRVRLNADRNNAGVCAFYEANGFTHDGDGFFQKSL